MKISAHRIPTVHNSSGFAWRIWEVKVAGRTFEVDGQNFEDTTREWQVFETTSGFNEWVDTVPTKREGLELIEELIGK